uniref:Uncharacterized protein n=1 Tax=Anguilla anguilla TaxID=7936 RepID=A0A0E9XVT4_ANGAN
MTASAVRVIIRVGLQSQTSSAEAVGMAVIVPGRSRMNFISPNPVCAPNLVASWWTLID